MDGRGAERGLALIDGINVRHLARKLRALHRWHAHPHHRRPLALRQVHEGGDAPGIEDVPLRRRVGDVGRAGKVLGVVGPDHDHDNLGSRRAQVGLQLRRPVEVVGSSKPRALAGVQGGLDHPRVGQVVLEGSAHVDAERITQDQHAQRVGGGRVRHAGDRGRAEQRRRARLPASWAAGSDDDAAR